MSKIKKGLRLITKEAKLKGKRKLNTIGLRLILSLRAKEPPIVRNSKKVKPL